eukprot:1066007-Rhodomonas_salina.1
MNEEEEELVVVPSPQDVGTWSSTGGEDFSPKQGPDSEDEVGLLSSPSPSNFAESEYRTCKSPSSVSVSVGRSDCGQHTAAKKLNGSSSTSEAEPASIGESWESTSSDAESATTEVLGDSSESEVL